MEHPAAPGLASKLGALPHTNAHGERGAVHIPGFRQTAGVNPEQAEQVGILGLAIAEGCIEALDEDGYEVVHKDELDARVAELADDADDIEAIHVRCMRCRQVVHSLNMTLAGGPYVDVGLGAEGMLAHQQVCQ